MSELDGAFFDATYEKIRQLCERKVPASVIREIHVKSALYTLIGSAMDQTQAELAHIMDTPFEHTYPPYVESMLALKKAIHKITRRNYSEAKQAEFFHELLQQTMEATQAARTALVEQDVKSDGKEILAELGFKRSLDGWRK